MGRGAGQGIREANSARTIVNMDRRSIVGIAKLNQVNRKGGVTGDRKNKIQGSVRFEAAPPPTTDRPNAKRAKILRVSDLSTASYC